MILGFVLFCYKSSQPSLALKKEFFRKPTRPSLPLKKAPPLTPALSPQERGKKPPCSAVNAPPVPPLREGPYPIPKP